MVPGTASVIVCRALPVSWRFLYPATGAGILKERTSRTGVAGILLVVVAIALLACQPEEHSPVHDCGWMYLTAIPMLAWGVQGFVLKQANVTAAVLMSVGETKTTG